MVITRNKILSVVFTMMMMILYYFVPEEVLFGSFWGILIVIGYIVAVLATNHAIAEYDDRVIEMGKKHKEKLISINLLILYMMFIVIILYFVDYVSTVHWLMLYFVIGCLLFLILYFILAFIFDYVILEEDGFTSNYFIKMRKVNIKYKDIESIRFGSLMNTFIIRTKDKTAIVDVALINSNKFLNEISRNTSRQIHQDAFMGLEKHFKAIHILDNKNKLRFFDKK